MKRTIVIMAILLVVIASIGCAMQKKAESPRRGQGTMDSPQSHVEMAAVYVRNGDLEKAHSEYQLALSLDPKYIPALEGEANLQRLKNQGAPPNYSTQIPSPPPSQPTHIAVPTPKKLDKPLQIVVYNIEAQGIGASICDIMTSAIVTELSSSESLFVRDEKTTIAVLKEKGMAQTDYCDAEKCRIDNAKLIKADRIILGNIGKLDEKVYVITIRVADVNGTTIYPQRQVCSDCSTTQILGVVDAMAKNIRVFLETGRKL